MATFIWPSSPVSITGVATEATLLLVEQNTEDTVTELQTLNAAVPSLATEATVSSLATEATVSTLATEATVATRASETTLATRASETSLLTRASETTLATRASEATLATRASEASLLNLIATDFATEATLSAALSELTSIAAEDFATETTLATRATEATALSIDSKLTNISTDLAVLEDKTAASLFTQVYDTIQVTATSVNGPTQIVTKAGGLAGVIVQTLDIVYDIDGNFESAVVS